MWLRIGGRLPRMPLMSTVRRALAIVVALAAAAGFAVAVQGGRWWVIGADVGIGTISTQRCFGGQCGFGSLAWTGGSETWTRAGFATYAAGLVAALVLVALAGALAAKRAGRLVAAVTAVSVVTAAVAGATFYMTRPALPGATLGRGAIVFVVALIAAIVAAALTLTARRAAP
jgi:hypothetical protein